MRRSQTTDVMNEAEGLSEKRERPKTFRVRCALRLAVVARALSIVPRYLPLPPQISGVAAG